MDFPKNIRDLEKRIADIESSAMISSNEIERLKIENQEKEAIIEILNGLVDSLECSNPGESRAAYFFLNAGQRVVVQGFLPDNTISKKTFGNYKVVKLSDIDKGECLKCKSSQPVIERYIRVSEVYGDWAGGNTEWVRQYFILCLSCNLRTTVELYGSAD